MSYTLAAIKAAKEVQADTYAPELYRLSNEWFLEAKNEYKYKNFKAALEYALKARNFAEQAEFEAIRAGGTRSNASSAMPVAPAAPTEMSPRTVGLRSEAYPAPTGTPADVYEQRKAEEDAARAPASQTTVPKTPGLPESISVPPPPLPGSP